ncbi:MAG: TetR/AcrR family transcriptional regulator [Actinomycetota bacterium]|nr:TetR/AcrR family transcriptional regulator [Myxococcota bacterium]MDQ3176454.1 TetR/AcrR family transcriptional regulator [Actinomycetota bacterium]
MSRPVDADSAATYDAIVAAALQVLAEQGHAEQTSLRQVAKLAEVSVGTIQYYFVNKGALLEVCLDGYYSRMVALLTRLTEKASTGDFESSRAFVEDSAREVFRWARAERGLIALRVATNNTRGELHPDRQANVMGSMTREVTKWLAPHVELDELETRLAVQSVGTIMSRMAMLSDSELENLTGLPAAEARARVEDHVAEASCRLLCLDAGRPRS